MHIHHLLMLICFSVTLRLDHADIDLMLLVGSSLREHVFVREIPCVGITSKWELNSTYVC